jgi:flagellar M-ring protein FliF
MADNENIVEQFKAWPAMNKIGLLAVMIMTITSMVLLFSWIQKSDFQVLYSNLSQEDAGRIVEELQSKKIPYELVSSGTVLVAANKVHEIRLELAGQGLPQGAGVRFEIFDNTSFTTSEFVQKLNYKRALEGELSRTIRSLSGVQQSRVHLVMPDKSVFAFQESRPETTAAVFITLQNGRTLSRNEIQGIVHLVSSSVEDLDAGSITVVDNKGELLTRPSSDSMLSLSGSQMEYQQAFETNTMTKILSMLEPVVGKGKIQAKVSAAFNFTRSEKTEEKYDPDGVVVRSEQKSTEKSSTGFSGGVPGVSTNSAGGSSSGGSTGLSQKQDEMINYETSKTITRVINSPVALERLTVALVIDGILASQKETVENADQYDVRSDEDIKYYEDIVKKTIGFTEDRGDEISLSVMPFKKPEVIEVGEVKKDYLPLILTILKYFVPIVIALMFFLLIVKPLMNSLSKVPARRMTRAIAGEEGLTGLEAPSAPKELTLQEQVVDWAGSNSGQAAGMIKGWVEEK